MDARETQLEVNLYVQGLGMPGELATVSMMRLGWVVIQSWVPTLLGITAALQVITQRTGLMDNLEKLLPR